MILKSPSGSFLSFLGEYCMLGLWFGSVQSMESTNLPSFCLIFFLFSLVPDGSISADIIPSLLWLLLRWLIKSMSCTHDLFIKWWLRHTLGVLLRANVLIFCNMGRLSIFQISNLVYFCLKGDPSCTFNTWSRNLL